MCEFSQKLIAWLDRELPVDEALEVELHLGACALCRGELRTYERLSGALEAYCDAAMESSAQRSQRQWKPAVLGAGAVAAVLALLLASPRIRNTQPPNRATQAHAAASVVAKRMPPRVEDGHRGEAVNRTSSPPKGKARSEWRGLQLVAADSLSANPPVTTGTNWQTAEPAIQITIPADAVLPPGAAPEGVSFVAEVSITPDGSAELLFMQP